MEYDTTTLEELTGAFVNQYKRVLQDNNKVATGALLNSIHGDVIVNGTKVSVNIYANEEWKYVEYGRKPGRRPPMDAILSWIKVKGLPRSGSLKMKNGKLPTENQLAFLIARKIGREGIPAGNYLGNLIESTGFYEKVKEECATMIKDAIYKMIMDELEGQTTIKI